MTVTETKPTESGSTSEKSDLSLWKRITAIRILLKQKEAEQKERKAKLRTNHEKLEGAADLQTQASFSANEITALVFLRFKALSRDLKKFGGAVNYYSISSCEKEIEKVLKTLPPRKE